ncbi:ATP-binding protein [soil metagenome]
MKASRFTIRARITGGSLLIAILISIVAGILLYTQVQRIVNDGQVAVLANIEAPYLTALADPSSEEVDPPGPLQLVAVVPPSGSSKVDTLPAKLSAKLDDLVESPTAARTVPVSGGSYLVRVTEVNTNTGAWEVVSAVDNAVQVSVLNQVALLLIATIAGINLTFGAASWLIGTAALSPVARLRRSASELVGGPGRELLPVGPARDEIAELARTLNELITQLHDSAERERQIVSDASHELRTPLAILTTQLELALAESGTIDELRSDVEAAQRTLRRLTGLATSLLELSRIDAQASAGRASFDELSEELADAADRGRTRAAGRDVRIEYRVDGSAVQDAAVAVPDFGRVCDNLVANALAVPGGVTVIELSVSATPEGAMLTVDDDGGGMDPKFVDHAFARFSQANEARTGGGAGLGLAIVAGIASVAGGDVALRNRPNMGLAVDVRFPWVEGR